MLRDRVAPELRKLGFVGSGQNFALPSESHWALLGFQRSAWSSAESVDFTINLTVVSRDAWEKGREQWPTLPERPGANWGLSPMMEPAFGGAYWHSRIGDVMPGRRDRWWKIASDADAADVTYAVVAEIREFAVPAMRERMAENATPA